MVKAIVGANWGDEGKGKITDMLAQSFSFRISPLVSSVCSFVVYKKYISFPSLCRPKLLS